LNDDVHETVNITQKSYQLAGKMIVAQHPQASYTPNSQLD